MTSIDQRQAVEPSRSSTPRCSRHRSTSMRWLRPGQPATTRSGRSTPPGTYRPVRRRAARDRPSPSGQRRPPTTRDPRASSSRVRRASLRVTCWSPRLSMAGNPSITVPSGWSLVQNQVSGSSFRQVVYVRRRRGEREPVVRLVLLRIDDGRRHHHRIQRCRSHAARRRRRWPRQHLVQLHRGAERHDKHRGAPHRLLRDPHECRDRPAAEHDGTSRDRDEWQEEGRDRVSRPDPRPRRSHRDAHRDRRQGGGQHRPVDRAAAGRSGNASGRRSPDGPDRRRRDGHLLDPGRPDLDGVLGQRGRGSLRHLPQ